MNAGQEEDFLLDFGREEREVHYLCDAGACEAGESGNFGVVADGPVVDQFLKVDGERHETGDSRDAPRLAVFFIIVAPARFSFTGPQQIPGFEFQRHARLVGWRIVFFHAL